MKLTLCFILSFVSWLGSPRGAWCDDDIRFSRDIAPILLRHCQTCHGPEQAKSKYRLDTFQRLMQPGASDEPAITPGKPTASELYRLLVTEHDDERMPQKADALPDKQIALIKRWIEQGALFDGKAKTAPLIELLPAIKHPAAPKVYPRPLPMTAVAFSKDGDQVFISGYHEITVWRTADGKMLRRIGNVDQRTYGLAVSPDSQTIAATSGTPGQRGEVRLFRVKDGSLRTVLHTSIDVMLDVSFSPDGERLAACGTDGAIRMWHPESGTLQHKWNNHADWVHAITFDDTGERLASASRDKTAKVFAVKDGKQLVSYAGHGDAVTAIAFHPDKGRMFSAGADNRIHQWKIADRKREATISFGNDVFDLIRHKEHLFACSADRTARLFSAKDRKEIRKFEGHADWVHAIAYHAASQRLITAGQDGQVRVWHSANGKLLHKFVASPGVADK